MLTRNFYPIMVWWQVLGNVEYWVKERGVNIIAYGSQMTGTPGDWEVLHQKVEALRQQGYNIWVIRMPAYLLTPGTYDLSFDIKWKSHLYAFALLDELEDKVEGGGLWGNQKLTFDYVTKEITAYKKWMSDIQIFCNFNGTHISDPKNDSGLSKTFYTTLASLGIDILCQDEYVVSDQMHNPDGTKFFQPGDFIKGTVLLKQWTGKPCWTYLETCNQDIAKPGDPGWSPPWIYDGSRSPTPIEFWQWLYYIKLYGSEGIAYFPQAHFGAINDATDPQIIPILADTGRRWNPVTMNPVVPPIVPAPAKLIAAGVYFNYDDGSQVLTPNIIPGTTPATKEFRFSGRRLSHRERSAPHINGLGHFPSLPKS